MNKKQTKQERKQVKEKRKGNSDFFQADWNDDVYVQRTIAKRGKVGGIKLG